MKTELMQKCASYRLPELEFILVDDYWFSYILQSRLKAKLIKIKTKMKIC